MKLSLIAWGKAGQGPEAELAERYLRRLPWAWTLRELADGAAPPVAAPMSRTIVLDERGETLTSAAFAALLGGWRDGGVREARFLVGPADGHAEPVRRSADRLIGFGAMTWPHLLARAMLAEQLWRATAILSGHPYHRE